MAGQIKLDDKYSLALKTCLRLRPSTVIRCRLTPTGLVVWATDTKYVFVLLMVDHTILATQNVDLYMIPTIQDCVWNLSPSGATSQTFANCLWLLRKAIGNTSLTCPAKPASPDHMALLWQLNEDLDADYETWSTIYGASDPIGLVVTQELKNARGRKDRFIFMDACINPNTEFGKRWGNGRADFERALFELDPPF